MMTMMGPRLDVGIVWAQCDGMVCGSLGTEQSRANVDHFVNTACMGTLGSSFI